MRDIFIKEQKKYSIEELNRLLILSTEDTKFIINYLKELSIIKVSNNYYVFDYVGIIFIENLLIKVYPKYIEKNISVKDFRTIMDVIIKYQNQFIESKIYYGNELKNNEAIGLMIMILYDFINEGLYKKEKKIIKYNGIGSINWDKTIDTVQPFFIGNNPVYIDYYSNSTTENKMFFFKKLHKAILYDIYSKLNTFILNDILNINVQIEFKETIDELGSLEYIINKLKNEMINEFKTRELSLLKMMYRYLMDIYDSNLNFKVNQIGTTNFNLLWEKVCSEVLDNDFYKLLSDFKLKDSENIDNIRIKDIITTPKWINNQQDLFETIGTLRPDIIKLFNNNNQQYLGILDAKYYKFKINQSQIYNQPGIDDISKQYMYQFAYLDFSIKNKLNFFNAFLLPADKEKTFYWGVVQVDFFKLIKEKFNLKDINIYMVSANEIYNLYLRNQKISIHKLLSL